MKLSEAMHYILVCGDYFLTYNSQSGKFYCYDLTTGAYSCVNEKEKENEEAKWYISFGLT